MESTHVTLIFGSRKNNEIILLLYLQLQKSAGV